MNVLLLAQAPNSPSTRFRILPYLERMKSARIRCVLSPLPSPAAHHLALARATFHAREILSRVRGLSRTRDFDVVLLQKKLASIPLRGLDLLLSAARGRLLYDFDDAVFLPHEGIMTGLKGKLLQARDQTRKLIQMSKAVTAGNDYLAGFARRYCDRVHLVPTAVDPEKLKPRAKSGRAIVVGWSGSASTNKYLNLVAPALQRAWRKHRFKVLVMSSSAEGLDLGSVPFDFHPWSAETEAETIARFDIGLGPLPRDDWARGKCALKLLQYMACEVPAVASPVGANADVIHHAQNGLLADGLDEWEEALNQLVESPALRKQLGKAGRATVIERYSTDVVWPKFLRALEEAAG